MSDQPENIRYRDVMGVLRDAEMTIANEIALPGAGLPARLVHLGDGRRLVQKYVPKHLRERSSTYYDRLDNEIRAGTRFGQVFSVPHPPELPELVGYNTDVEEPYVLLGEYRGVPAADHVGGLDDQQQRRFQIGLMNALHHASHAGVVHGAVRLDALRWDGATLQLVDFEWASRAGEPRRSPGPVRPLPAEQVQAAGTVATGDDMWTAGLVIRSLTQGPSDGRYPDTSLDPERLRTLLAGVFDPRPESRPAAEELLRRLHVEPTLATQPDLDDALMEGRRMFMTITERKYPRPVQPARPQPQVVPDPARRPPWVWIALVVVVIAVVIVVVRVVGG